MLCSCCSSHKIPKFGEALNPSDWCICQLTPTKNDSELSVYTVFNGYDHFTVYTNHDGKVVQVQQVWPTNRKQYTK